MKTYRNFLCLAIATLVLTPTFAVADSVMLYAAGSFNKALDLIASNYEKKYSAQIVSKFGPSGLLRKEIESGANVDVFASANMAHPEQLAASGWGSPVVLFTRNQLCALAQAEVIISTENFLESIKNEKIQLGTSTPKADPSGDYAWKLFEKADKIEQGSFSTLAGKALQLTGGEKSEKAPEGYNQYAWIMDQKKADVFLTYCTNAVAAQKQSSELQIIKVPNELAVGADYALIVKKDANEEAWRLAMYILSPEGQDILKDYGFEAIAVQGQ